MEALLCSLLLHARPVRADQNECERMIQLIVNLNKIMNQCRHSSNISTSILYITLTIIIRFRSREFRQSLMQFNKPELLASDMVIIQLH